MYPAAVTDYEHTPNGGPWLWIASATLLTIGAASCLVIPDRDTVLSLLLAGLVLLAALFFAIGGAQLWQRRSKSRRRR